jgi:hypothetical protein
MPRRAAQIRSAPGVEAVREQDAIGRAGVTGRLREELFAAVSSAVTL